MCNWPRQLEHENRYFHKCYQCRIKNIFTAISPYPTGKHEIKKKIIWDILQEHEEVKKGVPGAVINSCLKLKFMVVIMIILVRLF